MAQHSHESDRAKSLEQVENVVENALSSGRVDRAEIPRAAQQDAEQAVSMVGLAKESDEAVDEATKLASIAIGLGDRSKIKMARTRERDARKKAKADHRAATHSAKRAFEAIKFSDPTKLGFMRVIQVLFAIHIISTVAMLIFTSRDTVVYSSTNITDWIMVVLEGVAFWFFLNRFRIGRPFVIIMSLIGIVANLGSSLYLGTFTPFSLFYNNLYYVILILYFTFSSRVKAVLVNDFSLGKGYYDKDEFAIDRRGWPFIRNLVIYFVVFSVLGHWMEAAMCQLIRLGLVQGEYDPTNTMLWRDWLYPYPMEGAAVVLIAVVLYPLFVWLKKKLSNRFAPYAISFLVNMLTCTAIEFFSGLVFNANLQHWDYTENFCNIMGQVCLQNSIAFGVACSLITWVVYPAIERWLARVPTGIMNVAFVVIAITGALLFSLYAIEPPEGTDLGAARPTAEEAADDTQGTETGSIVADTTTLSLAAIGTLEADLENANDVSSSDKEKIVAHLEDIRASYTEILGILETQGTVSSLDLSTDASGASGVSSAPDATAPYDAPSAAATASSSSTESEESSRAA